jgi:hypothetical protein
MKVITNEKLIKRNGRLGQIATIGGLLVLVSGMYVSFRYPNYSAFAWLALIIGFALSQVGLYFGNRWGRHPRPDELIDQGLKGLNDQYAIYHYMTPAAHLLVGPSGLWVIMPFHQAGKIKFDKNRWRQVGGGFRMWYMRVFAQESIGRPDIDAPAESAAVNRFIEKKLPNLDIPEANIAMVFTSDKADLEVDDAPILTLPLKELKNTIRKSAKTKPLSPEQIQEINALFV